MKIICPKTHQELRRVGDKFYSEDGKNIYPIVDDIPNCIYPLELKTNDAKWQKFYDWFAPFYEFGESFLGKLLTSFDIIKARASVGEAIPFSPGQTILDVSPGPGTYQAYLAEKIGEQGHLTALDISQGMLLQCRKQTKQQKPQPQLIRGNASYLPFEDNTFDGLFHFGGVNLFSEPERSLKEFSRVVKTGGWVVFGDEKFSKDWVARTDWKANILRRINPGYNLTPPNTPNTLDCIQEIEVIGGLGYLRICKVK